MRDAVSNCWPSTACFGGMQRFLEHASREIGLPMRLSVFLPPQAALGARCPRCCTLPA
jgi:hypothetical protein